MKTDLHLKDYFPGLNTDSLITAGIIVAMTLGLILYLSF